MIERPRLAPCTDCHRHVRLSEASCPFCGAVLASLVAPTRRMPPRSLGRAAIFAVGSALASSASGCYQAHERDTPTIDAAPEEHDAGGGGSIVLYGTAPFDAGGSDEDFDAGAPVTHYGGPWPLPDSGFVPAPVDAGPEVDANGGSQVLYGGPPGEG